ncbi:MAG TPA: beta-ketoacyl synthase chain length factor [Steroidobacteraceae bacterium]|nr:beta-ketoacyl synthase chain length factor [Steroidobacteraceae bacterium]
MTVWVESVGIAAPGLIGWSAAREVLKGTAAYVPADMPPYAPSLLPPNERRRASPTVRIAFQAAEDAVQGGSIPAAELATVFASSDADLNIIHRISLALTQTPRLVSPTDFHNSVHNAAAGYWSIAVGSRAPSTTISAYDFSFAAGLAETCTLVEIERRSTLLVAFDLPPPQPLFAKRPIGCVAGIALVLTHSQTPRSIAKLNCKRSGESPTNATTPALEELRRSNPATASIPLLERLARGDSGPIVLPLSDQSSLRVDVSSVDAR